MKFVVDTNIVFSAILPLLHLLNLKVLSYGQVIKN